VYFDGLALFMGASRNANANFNFYTLSITHRLKALWSVRTRMTSPRSPPLTMASSLLLLRLASSVRSLTAKRPLTSSNIAVTQALQYATDSRHPAYAESLSVSAGSKI